MCSPLPLGERGRGERRCHQDHEIDGTTKREWTRLPKGTAAHPQPLSPKGERGEESTDRHGRRFGPQGLWRQLGPWWVPVGFVENLRELAQRVSDEFRSIGVLRQVLALGAAGKDQ